MVNWARKEHGRSTGQEHLSRGPTGRLHYALVTSFLNGSAFCALRVPQTHRLANKPLILMYQQMFEQRHQVPAFSHLILLMALSTPFPATNA